MLNYIISKEQYQALKATWASKKEHNSTEIIAYNILRGFDAKRGFTDITNPRKIENGLTPDRSFIAARGALKHHICAPQPSAWIAEDKHKERLNKFNIEFKAAYGFDYFPELAEKVIKANG